MDKCHTTFGVVFDTLRIDELETDAQRMAFAIFYAQQVCDLLEKTHSGTFPHGSLTVTKELESTDWLFEYRYDGSPFFLMGNIRNVIFLPPT